MIGPAADAEKAAFRDMLKVFHGGRGQGLPALPVPALLATIDVGLPRIGRQRVATRQAP